jgi:hypothetical protein
VVVQRVKLPPNYQVPPHTHPYAETVTLISGSVGFGMGEKFDNKGALATPGTLFAVGASRVSSSSSIRSKSLIS